MPETTFKPTFALALQVENQYGTHRIVAHPVYHNEKGEMLNPSMSWGGVGRELADFEISAYLSNDNVNPWGHNYQFRPYQVQLDEAEIIVKVLRKLDKGMKLAVTERGYVTDGQFHEFIFRVAGVLGIREYYVRNTDKQMAMSGDRWKRADGGTVQYWIRERLREVNPSIDN